MREVIWVPLALGIKSLDNLTPAQRAYSEKVRAKLEQNARRLRGELLEATRLYKKGVLAYSKGMYDDSVKWMEAALEETDPRSMLGGKIQIQMALVGLALSFLACWVVLLSDTDTHTLHGILQSKTSVDDSLYFPCNQSDTWE